jgi:heme-degrading monooxygenase HmoA
MMVLVVTAPVKPNAGREFAEAFQTRLLPSLRNERGFRDEMLFVVPGGPDMMLITFWDSRDDAEHYERVAWPEVAQSLSNIIDRARLKLFQLAHSTLHREGAAAFPPQSPITTEPTGVGA